jgi:hypothetical protein
MAMSTARVRLEEIAERVEMTWDEVLEYLDSPAGRRFRRILAGAVIISVPLLTRLPVFRRTPIGRAVELIGGAALLVKLAEAIRDWERSETAGAAHESRVIDLPAS